MEYVRNIIGVGHYRSVSGIYEYKKEFSATNTIEGYVAMYCSRNRLSGLEIPEGVTYLYCSDNWLTSIEVPDSLIYLNIRNNRIKEFLVPSTLRILECDKGVELKGDLSNLESIKLM